MLLCTQWVNPGWRSCGGGESGLPQEETEALAEPQRMPSQGTWSRGFSLFSPPTAQTQRTTGAWSAVPASEPCCWVRSGDWPWCPAECVPCRRMVRAASTHLRPSGHPEMRCTLAWMGGALPGCSVGEQRARETQAPGAGEQGGRPLLPLQGLWDRAAPAVVWAKSCTPWA